MSGESQRRRGESRLGYARRTFIEQQRAAGIEGWKIRSQLTFAQNRKRAERRASKVDTARTRPAEQKLITAEEFERRYGYYPGAQNNRRGQDAVRVSGFPGVYSGS